MYKKKTLLWIYSKLPASYITKIKLLGHCK